MSVTLGVFNGLVGFLRCSTDAFADGYRWAYPNPESNAFFKIYTGIDHDGLTGASGDLPDARRKQLLGTALSPPHLTDTIHRI